MSLASRAGDLFYSYRFVKLLTTPWEETDAYRLGLIDNQGKRDKREKLDSPERKSAYTPFVRLVFNVKRLLQKVPGGDRTLSSYAAALFLLKEHFSASDKTINKIIQESNIDILDFLEEESKWYILEDGQLSPGVYRIKNDKLLAESLEEMVNAKDQVRILDDAYPIGDVAGVNIYEAIHVKTNKKIFVTIGELIK
mgnify:FL=1